MFREVTVAPPPPPPGSRSSPNNLQRDSRVDSKTSHRPSRRFSVSLLFSYFCDSQEIRGSLCNFGSEENPCFHFGSAFPNGYIQCHSTDFAPSRLGSFVGRLPSCAGTPSVQESVGFQVPRQGLCVQGLACLRGSVRG